MYMYAFFLKLEARVNCIHIHPVSGAKINCPRSARVFAPTLSGAESRDLGQAHYLYVLITVSGFRSCFF